MNFFQYLFCNQYAEIKGRGGDTRMAQLNTILLSTVLVALYIILAVVIYGTRLNPGYLERILSVGFSNGKAAGSFLAAVISFIVFVSLKYTIGSRDWYDRTVEQFNGMSAEEQMRTAKKGVRYFVIASLPIATFILWALLSLF